MIELDSGAEGSGGLEQASNEEAKASGDQVVGGGAGDQGIGLFSYGMRKRKIKKP